MIKNKKTISMGKVAAVGAGVVGVAAVGAGAYYLFGPKGKQHQKNAKVWATKMEKEIQIKLKKAKSLTKPIYHGVVDAIAETYSKEYKNYSEDIKSFAKKLKDDWKNLRQEAVPVIKKAKSTVKKSVKKHLS